MDGLLAAVEVDVPPPQGRDGGSEFRPVRREVGKTTHARAVYAWPLGIGCGVGLSWILVILESKGWIDIDG